MVTITNISNQTELSKQWEKWSSIYDVLLEERANEVNRGIKIDNKITQITQEINKFNKKILFHVWQINNHKLEIDTCRWTLDTLEVELNLIERVSSSDKIEHIQSHVKTECIRCLVLEEEKEKLLTEKDNTSWKMEQMQLKVNLLEEKNIQFKAKILELEGQNEKLTEAWNTDNLTRIWNRKKFNEDAKLLIKNREVFSIAFIDIDHFKEINDNYWHSSWDLILQFLASKLKMAGDVYRRWWEEFLIIAECDELELQNKLENIKNGCLRWKYKLPDFPWSEVEIKFSAWVIKHESSLNLTQLTKYADALMYEAKHTRDTIITFQESNNKAKQNLQSTQSWKY